MKKRPPPTKYEPGDYVWVYQKQFDSTFATTRKLLPSWILAQVIHCYPGGTYKLVNEDGEPYGEHTVSHWRLRPVKQQPAWNELTVPRSWDNNETRNKNSIDLENDYENENNTYNIIPGK